MEFPIPGDLVNPLTSQFGSLSVQDKAFLDAFSRQEQQELHGVPRPGPVDPTTLFGQLEQVGQSSCFKCIKIYPYSWFFFYETQVTLVLIKKLFDSL